MLLWIVLLNAALCVAGGVGNVTRDVCREQICSCGEVEGDLHVDCEKRGLASLRHLTGPSSQFYHLLLHGNSLSRLFPNEFANFYNAVSLHLEGNGLHDIVPGAFLGLQLVKRLHVNNNKIRAFRRSTFLGLDDLEYLQADFNLLRDIDPAVFRDLSKLEVLILNDNLISALPANVFQHVPITTWTCGATASKRCRTRAYWSRYRELPRCCWRTTHGTATASWRHSRSGWRTCRVAPWWAASFARRRRGCRALTLTKRPRPSCVRRRVMAPTPAWLHHPRRRRQRRRRKRPLLGRHTRRQRRQAAGTEVDPNHVRTGS